MSYEYESNDWEISDRSAVSARTASMIWVADSTTPEKRKQKAYPLLQTPWFDKARYGSPDPKKQPDFSFSTTLPEYLCKDTWVCNDHFAAFGPIHGPQYYINKVVELCPWLSILQSEGFYQDIARKNLINNSIFTVMWVDMVDGIGDANTKPSYKFTYMKQHGDRVRTVNDVTPGQTTKEHQFRVVIPTQGSSSKNRPLLYGDEVFLQSVATGEYIGCEGTDLGMLNELLGRKCSYLRKFPGTGGKFIITPSDSVKYRNNSKTGDFVHYGDVVGFYIDEHYLSAMSGGDVAFCAFHLPDCRGAFFDSIFSPPGEAMPNWSGMLLPANGTLFKDSSRYIVQEQKDKKKIRWKQDKFLAGIEYMIDYVANPFIWLSRAWSYYGQFLAYLNSLRLGVRDVTRAEPSETECKWDVAQGGWRGNCGQST